MTIFGGSCEECDFNSTCSHQKLLWDGKSFTLTQAICRTTDGQVYYHKGYHNIISEPMDWYLWGKKRGLIIYGREQFIRVLEQDRPSSVVHRPVSVTDDEPVKKKVIEPLIMKGPRLASVYAETSSAQGDLF